MTYDSWLKKYQPLQNSLAGPSAPFDGLMFETVGDEHAFIATALKETPQHVWTLVEYDGNQSVILPGWHFVNRLGHFITKEPWDDETIEIIT